MPDDYYAMVEDLAELFITKDPRAAIDMLTTYLDDHWYESDLRSAWKYMSELPTPTEGVRYEKRS